MGCWSATCGLSNLPIFEGDRVVCFIVKDGYPGLALQPSDHGKPFLIPCIGKYNDYGSIDHIEPSVFHKYFLDYFHQYFNLSPENDIEDLINKIERGSLENKKYSLFMVHYDLFDQLTEDNLDFFDLNNLLTILNKPQNNEVEKLLAEVETNQLFHALQFQIKYDMDYDLFLDFLKVSLGNIKQEDKTFFNKVLNFAIVLYECRKSWAPVTNCGPQFGEFDKPFKLAEYCVKKLSEMKKQIESYI